MAKIKMFCAYDGRLKIFMTPFFMMHTGQALRHWEEGVSDPSTMVCKHPADFVLFEVGEFDVDTGALAGPPHPVQIATALEYVKRPEDQLPLAKVGR